MKKLLSVGCSNTIGVNLEEEIGIFDYLRKDYDDSDLGKQVREYRIQNNFSTLVANNLGYDCINLGFSGASNERIIFTAIDYIENNEKPDLVLINLSGRSRVTFEIDNKLMDFDLSYTIEHFKENFNIDSEDFIPFIEFYKKHSVTDYNLYKKQQNLYRYIVLYMESKNIPYILSQTIPTGEQLTNYSDKIIDITFDEFNQQQGRKRAAGWHWLSDSHLAWSNLITEKAREYYAI